MEPMVSICCAAFNHAPYIAEALESFLELMCGVVGQGKETADGMDNAG